MAALSTLNLLVLALCLSTGLCMESLKADDGYEVFPAFPWSRYKMPSYHLNWRNARAACESDGGGSTLVVINSDKEAEVVGELATRISESGFHPWVGTNDLATEGRWVTVQGGLVSESGYNNWMSGSPSVSSSWNCGHVHANGLYHDDNCSFENPFICEMPNV